jgi:D-3-phosphoglycerate dehydrogenase / 2-oxoglutarate reductase
MALLATPSPSPHRPLTLTASNPTAIPSLLSPFPSFSLPPLRLSSRHHLSNRSLRFLSSIPAATKAVTAGVKPTILVADKLGDAGLDFLREFANVDCAYDLSPEELCAKISLCDALVVRSSTKVLVLN